MACDSAAPIADCATPADSDAGAECQYRLDDQVGFVLRQVSQRHAAIFARLVPAGLTPMQFSALVRLAEAGPLSQNLLGRQTAMDGATVKGVVERLHRKGLVVLRDDAADRRRMLVSLSSAGRALVRDLHSGGHAITTETLAPLSAREARQLLELLNRLA